jgi:hypothetical protein
LASRATQDVKFHRYASPLTATTLYIKWIFFTSGNDEKEVWVSKNFPLFQA